MSDQLHDEADPVVPLRRREPKQPEANPGVDKSGLDKSGNAIVEMLHNAADKAQEERARAVDNIHRVSRELAIAQDRARAAEAEAAHFRERAGKAEAEAAHFRDRATKAEEWLLRIRTQIDENWLLRIRNQIDENFFQQKAPEQHREQNSPQINPQNSPYAPPRVRAGNPRGGRPNGKN
jgi:hypothetical protein